MSAGPARVLVVDDSAFARKVLREVLQQSPQLEVVAVARDGLEALEKIVQLKPDVITLDLMMPNLDGLGLLGELGRLEVPPRVVVVSMSDRDSEQVAAALQLGAFGVVKKPTGLATDRLYELGGELKRLVMAAARAQVRGSQPLPVRPPAVSLEPGRVDLVAIGTSTGGPHALGVVLGSLPADFPAPIVMALHIPSEYTGPLARRLDASGPLRVLEAFDGLELEPGVAVLAKGGHHLRVERSGTALRARVDLEPADALYRPSVDLLFESSARACGAHVLGVVLTGMGDDGLLGARTLTEAGASVIVEAESSCVVYGMPRAVSEAGLARVAVPLEELAQHIVTFGSR